MQDKLELLYAVSRYLYIISYIAIISFALCRFAAPFIENRKKTFYAGLAYFATMSVLYVIPVILDNFTAYGLGVFAAFIVMCRIDRGNYRQKAFVAVTFFSLRWLSSYMASSLTGGMRIAVSRLAFFNEHQILQFIISEAIQTLSLLVTFIIIEVSTRCIIKAYIYKYENMSTKEMLMLIMPSVMSMLAYLIIQSYNKWFETNAAETVPDTYGSLAFIYYALSIVMIIVMTEVFQNIKARQEERLQSEMLSMQINSIKQHIKQVESLYNDMQSLKHDMANHVLTLEGLYTSSESGTALEYAKDLKTALTCQVNKIKTGNPVTDVILSEWKSEAEERNIRFNCDFHYPEDSAVNAFDVSVILNNAIQNSVENAAKNTTANSNINKTSPYISVLSYRTQNAFMIEIRNSFTGCLKWNVDSKLPVTSKENVNEHHGYGLSNIRKIAAKYFGDIDILQEDGEFCLSIMLMLV